MIGKVYRHLIWRLGLTHKLPKLIWTPVEEEDGFVKKNTVSHNFNFDVNFDNERINNSFNQQNEYLKNIQYVIETTENVVVEPVRGIAIMKRRRFIAKTRLHNYIFPDFKDFLSYKMGLRPVVKVKEAIHFDGYLGENYYHFYNEALNSLWLFQSQDILTGKPVIVGKKVYNTRYFQWLLQNNEWFGKLNWMVLDNKTFIEVDKLYKPYVFLAGPELWFRTRALFNPVTVQQPQRRIYLYRAPQFGRTIQNNNEIKAVLKKYQFELIDTGEMTMAEQMEIFAHTKYLIAIHGAGITNMLFSNFEALSVLEILPDTPALNIFYFWMAQALGIKYDAVVSSEMDKKLNFYLDPVKFEASIVKLLA